MGFCCKTMENYITETLDFLVSSIFYGLGFGMILAFIRPIYKWFQI